MPKRQARAAKLARQIQAVSGLSYTDCLKLCERPDSTWSALASELRTAGLTGPADNLQSVAAVAAEAGSWYEAGGHVQGLFFDTEDYKQGERVYRACGVAAERALNRAGFETHSFDIEAEAYHCAYLALLRAGTLTDGRDLARVALDVLDDDPLYCSDIVRSRGRAPFTYRTAAPLHGPDTPAAAAARRAARAMATAARVPFDRDEEWHEAAEYMVEAVWYACLAAGFPPLYKHPEHRDFFKGHMGGVLPSE
ncbi:hypothetical protein [Streptomyces sp. NPDC053367]|uniref:hypothetical protein n=1 Tax=Streptomyces sp. NPDC053367 TaxID=3365700 RepID=UPI0037D1769D